MDDTREGIARALVAKAEEALKKEGITKAFGLVFKDNDKANSFWEKMGYSLRTNLNYRNKSLDATQMGRPLYKNLGFGDNVDGMNLSIKK